MMLTTLDIEKMHPRGDAVEDEAPVRLRVRAVAGAVVECNAGRVEGGSGVGEAEAAVDGGGDCRGCG